MDRTFSTAPARGPSRLVMAAGLAFCLLAQGAQAQSVFDELQAMDDDAAQGEANEALQGAIRAAGYEVENHNNKARQYINEAISDATDNPNLVCYDLNAAADEYGQAYQAYKNASGEDLPELAAKSENVVKVEQALGCF